MPGALGKCFCGLLAANVCLSIGSLLLICSLMLLVFLPCRILDCLLRRPGASLLPRGPPCAASPQQHTTTSSHALRLYCVSPPLLPSLSSQRSHRCLIA